MGWLRDARQDLVDRYERLYARGAYASKAERARLTALVPRDRAPGDFGFRIRQQRRPDPPPPLPEPAQGSLF
jgi:hypothetical protein